MGTDQTRIRSEQNQVIIGTISPTPASSIPTTTQPGATHRVASASISSRPIVNRADILSWLASVKFRAKPWLVFEILFLASRVERVGFWPSPPPHQTVRTDFPYTAFAVTSSDGIINEDAKPSRTVQTKVMHVGIEGLTHRRTVGALASTLQVLRQFFQHIGMDCSKTFPRITVTEVVHPTGLPLVDLSNHRHNRHEAARLIGE